MVRKPARFKIKILRLLLLDGNLRFAERIRAETNETVLPFKQFANKNNVKT